MRCSKCSYISFDHYTSCPKCNTDLTALAEEFRGTTVDVRVPFFLGSAVEQISDDYGFTMTDGEFSSPDSSQAETADLDFTATEGTTDQDSTSAEEPADLDFATEEEPADLDFATEETAEPAAASDFDFSIEETAEADMTADLDFAAENKDDDDEIIIEFNPEGLQEPEEDTGLNSHPEETAEQAPEIELETLPEPEPAADSSEIELQKVSETGPEVSLSPEKPTGPEETAAASLDDDDEGFGLMDGLEGIDLSDLSPPSDTSRPSDDTDDFGDIFEEFKEESLDQSLLDSLGAAPDENASDDTPETETEKKPGDSK